MQGTHDLLPLSVVIPTFNRPDELMNCVKSIVGQTRPPLEIIIVDDGHLPGFPNQHECEAKGIRCVLHRKATPGLTASRNAGIRLASGEIVLFLDDDVVLEPGYIEATAKVFAQDTDGVIGGVGGVGTENFRRLSKVEKLRFLIGLIFLQNGFREGKVLRSGFCTEYGTTPFRICHPIDVDFLVGAAFAFRKEIFGLYSFSERFLGYGLGEDKEFSYRVSRTHRLVVTPMAVMDHRFSPRMRLDKHKLGREFICWRFEFFRRLVKKSPLDWPFFWYGISGYVLIRCLILAIQWNRENRDRLAGALQGVRQILFGQVGRDPKPPTR